MLRLVEPRVFFWLLFATSALLSAWWAGHHLPFPDEGAVMTNAARILRGGVFYRDIEAYPYPGSNYTLALFMALFGEHVTVARTLAGALFCATVLALYTAALPLLGRVRAALFGSSLLAFKLFGFPAFTAYIYSDFSFAFACIGIALLVQGHWAHAGRRNWPLFLAGVAFVACFSSKQNLGMYLMGVATAQLAFPAFFLRRSPELHSSPRRDTTLFLAGVVAGLLPIALYFGAHGVLGNMLYSGIVRPFTGYLPTSGIPYSYMLEWWNFGQPLLDEKAANYFPLIPWHLLNSGQMPFPSLHRSFWVLLEFSSRALYTVLPVVFVVPLLRWLGSWRRSPRYVHDPLLFGFTQLAFAVVLSAFPRADNFHIVSVAPVALLLAFALRRDRPHDADAPAAPVRVPAGELLGVVTALVLAMTLTGVMHSKLTYHLVLDRADLWIEPSRAWIEPLVTVVRARVPEGEPFFVYGNEAHIYFLSGRFFGWRFAQLYPGQTGPGRGEEVARVLAADPPLMGVRGVRGWPGLPEIPEYAPGLDLYVTKNFSEQKRFFDRFPPAAGRPPWHWVLRVLRPVSAPRPPRPG